jgi:phytoene dehydrogenase-like protein
MPPTQQYPQFDAIVVGAGFSGLSCAVRLGMMGKKVLLIEKHKIFGGLNSYYTRKMGGRTILFDSGLHALTNFCGPKDRHLPLGKVLKQLRLSYFDLKLCPQTESLLSFPWGSVRFSNEAGIFWGELAAKFPDHVSELEVFQAFLKSYDEFSAENQNSPFIDARLKLQEFLSSPQLVSLFLLAPLCYGSAWEHTMDWNLFVCLFRSIFLEGLSRPQEGILGLIKPLTEKLEELNVTVLTGKAVAKYIFSETTASQVLGIELADGNSIYADQVYCSTGINQLLSKIKNSIRPKIPSKVLTFVEVCAVVLKKDLRSHIPWTLKFESLSDEIQYSIPPTPYAKNLLIWSCSANYLSGVDDPEEVGFLKLSLLANSTFWTTCSAMEYENKKIELLADVQSLIKEKFPQLSDVIIGFDAFTPRTISKYTGHAGGAVYGGVEKWKEGKTPWENLFVIGADQGLPGIVGSMLSGITMANQYGFSSISSERGDAT